MITYSSPKSEHKVDIVEGEYGIYSVICSSCDLNVRNIYDRSLALNKASQHVMETSN
jgi:hypothetical protein